MATFSSVSEIMGRQLQSVRDDAAFAALDPEDKKCRICLSPAGHGGGARVRLRAPCICQKIWCNSCIRLWLMENNSCPQCRQQLFLPLSTHREGGHEEGEILDYEEMENEKEEMLEEIRGLEVEIEDLQQENEEKQQEIATLQHRNEELLQEYEGLEQRSKQEKKSLQRKLKEVVRNKQDLQRQVEKLCAEEKDRDSRDLKSSTATVASHDALNNQNGTAPSSEPAKDAQGTEPMISSTGVDSNDL